MKQTTSVRFPEKMSRKLLRIAGKTNVNESDLIRVAVAQFLERHTHTDDIITVVVKARQAGLI